MFMQISQLEIFERHTHSTVREYFASLAIAPNSMFMVAPSQAKSAKSSDEKCAKFPSFNASSSGINGLIELWNPSTSSSMHLPSNLSPTGRFN